MKRAASNFMIASAIGLASTSLYRVREGYGLGLAGGIYLGGEEAEAERHLPPAAVQTRKPLVLQLTLCCLASH